MVKSLHHARCRAGISSNRLLGSVALPECVALMVGTTLGDAGCLLSEGAFRLLAWWVEGVVVINVKAAGIHAFRALSQFEMHLYVVFGDETDLVGRAGKLLLDGGRETKLRLMSFGTFKTARWMKKVESSVT